jgi:hypothetical protein
MYYIDVLHLYGFQMGNSFSFCLCGSESVCVCVCVWLWVHAYSVVTAVDLQQMLQSPAIKNWTVKNKCYINIGFTSHGSLDITHTKFKFKIQNREENVLFLLFFAPLFIHTKHICKNLNIKWSYGNNGTLWLSYFGSPYIIVYRTQR